MLALYTAPIEDLRQGDLDCYACHHVAPADADRTPLPSALVSPLACSARSSGSALGPSCSTLRIG